jgi:hypothetical protein
MKINWLPLYLPPVYFLLLGGGRLLILPGFFLLLAVTTHLYLFRLEKRREKLQKNFVARKNA